MLTQLLIILFAFFVQFTDKAGSKQIALSQAALDKRAERNIAIDSLDYAVSPAYMDSLEALGVQIYHCSRWMNGACIETDSNTIQRIAQWTFVDTIYLTRQRGESAPQNAGVFGDPAEAKGKEAKGEETTWLSDPQTEQLQLHLLHEAGFHG